MSAVHEPLSLPNSCIKMVLMASYRGNIDNTNHSLFSIIPSGRLINRNKRHINGYLCVELFSYLKDCTCCISQIIIRSICVWLAVSSSVWYFISHKKKKRERSLEKIIQSFSLVVSFKGRSLVGQTKWLHIRNTLSLNLLRKRSGFAAFMR